MTEIKHYCDKCGTLILKQRTMYRCKCGPGLVKRVEIDLCSDCLVQFDAWIDARIAPAPRPSKTALAERRASP